MQRFLKWNYRPKCRHCLHQPFSVSLVSWRSVVLQYSLGCTYAIPPLKTLSVCCGNSHDWQFQEPCSVDVKLRLPLPWVCIHECQSARPHRKQLVLALLAAWSEACNKHTEQKQGLKSIKAIVLFGLNLYISLNCCLSGKLYIILKDCPSLKCSLGGHGTLLSGLCLLLLSACQKIYVYLVLVVKTPTCVRNFNWLWPDILLTSHRISLHWK